MKCKYNENVECDFDKPEDVRDDCRSFDCEPYEKAKLENALDLICDEIEKAVARNEDEQCYLSEKYFGKMGDIEEFLRVSLKQKE